MQFFLLLQNLISGMKENNMCIVRQGFCLEPKFYDVLLGRKLNKDMKNGTAIIGNTTPMFSIRRNDVVVHQESQQEII